MLFWIGHAEAAKWKRSVVKINASALWWSAPTDLGISHSLFLSPGTIARHYHWRKNNLLKTIRDRKEGLLIYTASGTNHDAVNNYSLAACDMVNLPICSVSKEKDCHSKQGLFEIKLRQPLHWCLLPLGSFKGRKENEPNEIKSRFLHIYSMSGWKSRLLLLQNTQRENFLSSSPHLADHFMHRWVPHWCFFHFSKFWLISQMHYAHACLRSSTQHSSLCANGLSASLRLRVQLRGESLICHLTVLFLSCCVIIPEANGQVKNTIYLKDANDELIWKSKIVLFLWQTYL